MQELLNENASKLLNNKNKMFPQKQNAAQNKNIDINMKNSYAHSNAKKMNFHRINIKNQWPMSNVQWPRPKSDFQFCNIRNIFMPLLIQHSNFIGQCPMAKTQRPRTIFNFNVLKHILECKNIKNHWPVSNGQA